MNPMLTYLFPIPYLPRSSQPVVLEALTSISVTIVTLSRPWRIALITKDTCVRFFLAVLGGFHAEVILDLLGVEVICWVLSRM